LRLLTEGDGRRAEREGGQPSTDGPPECGFARESLAKNYLKRHRLLPWETGVSLLNCRVRCADHAHTGRSAQRTLRGTGSSPNTYLATGRPLSIERHGHRLVLGVILQRPLAELAADAAGLVAAEGGGGIEHVVAVDPDRPGADPVGNRVGLA